MRADIRDRVIVITGAGRGLGRALALGLAEEGARVAVLARDERQAARTVKEITALVPGAPEPFGVAVDSPTKHRPGPRPRRSTRTGAGWTHRSTTPGGCRRSPACSTWT